MQKMTLRQWCDVLVEVAESKDRMVSYPMTSKQIAVIVILFEQLDGLVKVRFAADATWLRHQTMKLIWGHQSLRDLDMAIGSTMIDELGEDTLSGWFLSDKGVQFLCLVMDELAITHPTQTALL